MRGFALAGVPIGIVLGAVLGLPARRDDGWGGYGSFARRAARLGHVASVMLPLIAGFYALALDTWAHDAETALLGARLWTGGAVLLVLTLFAASWKRRLADALPLPATAVLAGGVLLAVAVLG